jgi:hypothetical protein
MLPTGKRERINDLRDNATLTVCIPDLGPVRCLRIIPPGSLKIATCRNPHLQRPVQLEGIIEEIIVIPDRADRADDELVAFNRLKNIQFVFLGRGKSALAPISPFIYPLWRLKGLPESRSKTQMASWRSSVPNSV